MKPFRRSFGGGRNGFTLIELLVVVGILGTLAGVVTLGVSQFIGRGKPEAASAELHSVQTVVTTLMSDSSLGAFPAAGSVGPGDTVITGAYDIGPYLATGLRGTYDVAVNGRVTQTAFP